MALTPTTFPLTHEYAIHYTRIWSRNLLFSIPSPSRNDVTTYLARISELTPNKPDVTLHDVKGREKRDKTAPILGVARFRWSRDVKMRLGEEIDGLECVIMTNESILKHSRYRFEFGEQRGCLSTARRQTEMETSASCTQPTKTKARRSYVWQRIRATEDGVTGWGKLSSGNYKLIDQKSGETIAVFLSNGIRSWKKAGKLRIRNGTERDLETIIVLSAASIAEKARM